MKSLFSVMKPSQIIRRAALGISPKCQGSVCDWLPPDESFEAALSYTTGDWYTNEDETIRRMFLLFVAEALKWEGR